MELALLKFATVLQEKTSIPRNWGFTRQTKFEDSKHWTKHGICLNKTSPYEKFYKLAQAYGETHFFLFFLLFFVPKSDEKFPSLKLYFDHRSAAPETIREHVLGFVLILNHQVKGIEHTHFARPKREQEQQHTRQQKLTIIDASIEIKAPASHGGEKRCLARKAVSRHPHFQFVSWKQHEIITAHFFNIIFKTNSDLVFSKKRKRSEGVGN